MCGADGGVALDVFHRSHAGADCADEIGHRRVALDVDELARGGVRVGHPPHDQAGPRLDHRIGLAGNRVRGGGEPKLGQRPRGRLTSAPQASRQVEHSVGRTHDAHPVEWLTGYERAEGVVVAQLAAYLAEQVHSRIPAATDEQHVTVHRLCGGS